MRIVDPDGGWVEHPEEGRNMEFWDAVHHATGIKSSTDVWFFGPTVEQELAVCRWSDEHALGSYVCTLDGYDHPQLGRVTIQQST
jgi:hypothetical protein